MKRIITSPLMTALLFVLAVGLIGFGGINAVQAAPTINSRDFGAQVQLASISTQLVEENAGGSKVVAAKGVEVPLIADGLVPKGEKFKIGKRYDEKLSVANNGTIDEYVRVTVYKYWVDAEGNRIKKTDLDPKLIELEFDTSKWTIDTEASTEERTVLYYQGTLAAGDETAPLTKSIKISPVTLGKVATGEYSYEGVEFQLKAVVDAVQTHNGNDAMVGAWGQTYSQVG